MCEDSQHSLHGSNVRKCCSIKRELQFFTIHFRHTTKRLAVLLGTCLTNINWDIEEDFIVWSGPRELQPHGNAALCTAVLVTVIFACLRGMRMKITAATERSGWNHEWLQLVSKSQQTRSYSQYNVYGRVVSLVKPVSLVGNSVL